MLTSHRSAFALFALVCCSVVLDGCASTSIAIKEKFGYAKREQLVNEVKEARDSQQEAKKQFESALAQFMATTGVKGGELEAVYSKLKSEYERSESKAKTVRTRIRDVENVADALFKEWREELRQYSSDSLRKASEQKLEETRRNYTKLHEAMKSVEARMDPVLKAFKDQVLFLKHNLNAQSVASLRGAVEEIRTDVGGLIRQMESAIAEAESFIKQINSAK